LLIAALFERRGWLSELLMNLSCYLTQLRAPVHDET
jgi:hypothetical protein